MQSLTISFFNWIFFFFRKRRQPINFNHRFDRAAAYRPRDTQRLRAQLPILMETDDYVR